MEKLFTVREAARELSIGRFSTYRLVQSGELGAVKIGLRPYFRVPESAIKEFIAKQAKTQTE